MTRPPRFRPVLAASLALALPLCGCTGRGAYRYAGDDGAVPYDGTDPAADAARSPAPRRFYTPPGPAQDPWGPYIREAAARFRVPERWVRAVMHQESGGREQAVSPVGAMGLMQVMPRTYAALRRRHGLGEDPYDPHNNILAGVAYIREMYDRYGSPGFLAGYNAGPDRTDSYLAGSSALPAETVNYLAAITPKLGDEVPLTGPLALYGGGSPGTAAAAPTVASLAAGCDANVAYDLDRPCTPLEQAARAPDPSPPVGGCDPDAAYDPAQPCRPVSVPAPSATTALYRSGAAPGGLPPAAGGSWSIQVGAFDNPGLARAVAEGARAEAPEQLRNASLDLPPTAPFGGTVLYRARLANLTAVAARDACQRLNQRQLPCVVVQPGSS